MIKTTIIVTAAQSFEGRNGKDKAKVKIKVSAYPIAPHGCTAHFHLVCPLWWVRTLFPTTWG